MSVSVSVSLSIAYSPTHVDPSAQLAANAVQEDNVLQAIRMFFDGAMPSGPAAANNPSMHSPMAIAPLCTMTDSSHMLAHDQRKGPAAPLQELQASWTFPSYELR